MSGVEQNGKKNGAASLPATAAEMETIDQVRELLFGLEKRTTDQRLRELDQKIDAQNSDMLAHVSMLETRLADTERKLDAQHRSALEDIASALGDLSERVRRLAARK